MAKQCPEIGKGQKTPYEKRLSGDEILNILCENDCERLTLDTNLGWYRNKNSLYLLLIPLLFFMIKTYELMFLI